MANKNERQHAILELIRTRVIGNQEELRQLLEHRGWVEEALEKLPEHQRVPLVLYHFEDLPYEDIAKKLGVSLAKVKTDILRARAALAAIIARSGARHETFTA
jgi:RNA polymerase sigma factor (sigma-70 family)